MTLLTLLTRMGVCAVAVLSLGLVPNVGVRLAWDASSSTNVTGYAIHYGVAARTYTNRQDVGNVLTATVTNLASGTWYYFAATAYIEETYNGTNRVLESDFSNEVGWLAGYQGKPPVAGRMVSVVVATK